MRYDASMIMFILDEIKTCQGGHLFMRVHSAL